VRNNRSAAFSMVRAARVAKKRCVKYIAASMNQRARVEKAVFSVGSVSRIYNEYLTQLELELS
jgi:hypothetical protein